MKHCLAWIALLLRLAPAFAADKANEHSAGVPLIIAGKVQELMARLEQALKQHGDTCALAVPNPKPAAWSSPPAKPRKQ